MHLLILEDEIPAFEKLRTYIASYLKEDFSYDWARSNFEAFHFLNNDIYYDIIFSDIQLLDGTCFETFEKTSVKRPIIFCSAYEEYLFQAFKSNGIAYLLKPYGEEEVNSAFQKYNTLFESSENQSINSEVFRGLKKMLDTKKTEFKKQFIIKNNKGLLILNVDDIAYIQAKGDFSRIIDCNGKSYLYSQNIGVIYASLNPQNFFRINRSELVQLKYISSIENHFKNRLLLTIQGIKEKVKTSANTTADFRIWIDR